MQAISARVREAGPQDADGCLAIYRPYVENSAVSWELSVPTTDEMAQRITAASASHAWLILESGDRTIGFAYSHAVNLHPAFKWSVPTGLYLADDHHRRGGGRALYTQLLTRLGERGYRRAFASITQPNEASNGFHRSMGFEDVGLYRRVEWKHDSWHDVAWMQRDLPSAAGTADPPGPIT
jgi:L-amino acid N-acyltransferase YncA